MSQVQKDQEEASKKNCSSVLENIIPVATLNTFKEIEFAADWRGNLADFSLFKIWKQLKTGTDATGTCDQVNVISAPSKPNDSSEESEINANGICRPALLERTDYVIDFPDCSNLFKNNSIISNECFDSPDPLLNDLIYTIV